MKTFKYDIPNNLSGLHDELLAAIPALRPKPNAAGELTAIISLEGKGDEVWLRVPNAVRKADVDTVVHETVAEIVAAYGADTSSAPPVEVIEPGPEPAESDPTRIEGQAERANSAVRNVRANGSAGVTAAAQSRKSYPSDLTDGEWRRVESLVPRPKSGGRPSKYDRREVLNGIVYQIRTGCSWRGLPQDLPPWKIVHHYYRTWREDGTWESVYQALKGVETDLGPGETTWDLSTLTNGRGMDRGHVSQQPAMAETT